MNQCAKLSKVQRYILARAAERPGTGRPKVNKGLTRADAMMRDLFLCTNPTNAQRATLARAISRLVSRGLMERAWWGLCVESGVLLTPAGWEMVNAVPKGNHASRFGNEVANALPMQEGNNRFGEMTRAVGGAP